MSPRTVHLGTAGARLAAIRRLHDQCGATAPDPLPRLFEPGDGLAGPPGQTQQLSDPPGDAGPDTLRKVLRHVYRTSRGARESAPGTGGF